MTTADMLATRRMTGMAGLAAAVLFGAGNALWAFDQPDVGASAREIIAFYSGASVRIVVGASVSVVAGALLVLFASGVRAILREHDSDDLLATTAFGGALLLAGAGLGAETINSVAAIRAGDAQLTRDLGEALFEMSYALGYNAAGVGVGVLMLAASAVALRARALLPRWLALLLLLLGVAFMTPLSRFVLGPSVLLLVAVSVQLLRTPTQDSAHMAS
jgi:hypothetical protein